MAAYITVGATTTHGGKVISGSPHTTHNGIPISRKGDKVVCKKCKKVTTILSGDASFIIDGAPIARAGDVTSCGAKLIAVQQSFGESGFEVMGVEQPAPIQFPKSDPESLFTSLAASDDKDSEDEMSDEELGIWVDVSTKKALQDGGLWAGAGTREELIYQERANSLWIDVNGDPKKFYEGMQKIGDEAGLVFDIMSFPLGLGAVSVKTGVKAGQYVIRSRFFPKFPAARILEKPKKIWGRSAKDIAKDFEDAGYKVIEQGSNRPNNKSEIIKIQGHKQITQIQVSPSSARHGGKYYKISTSDRGIVKVVDKKTYKPTPNEKATIIYK